METHAPSKLVPSSYLLIYKTLGLLKKSWLNLLISLCILILLTAAASLILYLAYFAIVYTNFIMSSFRNFIIFRISWGLLIFLVFYLITILAQIIIIKSLLEAKNFQEILKSVSKYFLNYICLSIIISILLVFFSLPIYTALFLFYAEQWVLGLLSLILGYILIIVLSGLLAFSPIILLEQNLYPLNALTKAYNLSKKYFASIIWKIFLLSLFLLVLNMIASMAYNIPFVGLLLWLVISLLAGLIFFAFPITLYKSLKI